MKLVIQILISINQFKFPLIEDIKFYNTSLEIKWDEDQSICRYMPILFEIYLPENVLFPCIYVKVRYIAAQEVQFLVSISQILQQFCDRPMFSLFLTKCLLFGQFVMELSPSRSWVFLFNQLTLLLLCLNAVTSKKVNATIYNIVVKCY